MVAFYPSRLVCLCSGGLLASALWIFAALACLLLVSLLFLASFLLVLVLGAPRSGLFCIIRLFAALAASAAGWLASSCKKKVFHLAKIRFSAVLRPFVMCLRFFIPV